MTAELNIAELKNALLNHHSASFVIDEGNGYYSFDYPTAQVSSKGEQVGLVASSIVAKLIKELIRKIDSNTSKLLRPMFKELKDHKRQIEQLKKEIKELREENRDYKENYGEFIAPSLVLNNLFNGGRVAKDTQLIPKNKWGTKYLKSAKYSKGVAYWLSLFEDWEIFKSYGRGEKYANYSFQQALNLVYYKIKKEKIQ
jgi:hypothetical protein